MKRLLASFTALANLFATATPAEKEQASNYAFYIKVASGISFAGSADVFCPNPPWNRALQGYNATLGGAAIADVGIGCEFLHLMDLEVSLSARSTFKYRKYQTPVSGGSAYTRKFDLDAIPILFSINFLGRGIPKLHWDSGYGKFYPVAGAGFGVSHLFITNFRTTGLPPTGYSAPYASFSSENQYTHRHNFTYVIVAGLEYSYSDKWAISTGYRFLDAGRFNGPTYQRVSSGASVDVSGDEWQMRFRANEWFIALKIFI